MRTIIGVACCLLCLCLAGVSGRAPAQEERPRSEKSSARAYLPSGAGATANKDFIAAGRGEVLESWQRR